MRKLDELIKEYYKNRTSEEKACKAYIKITCEDIAEWIDSAAGIDKELVI